MRNLSLLRDYIREQLQKPEGPMVGGLKRETLVEALEELERAIAEHGELAPYTIKVMC